MNSLVSISLAMRSFSFHALRVYICLLHTGSAIVNDLEFWFRPVVFMHTAHILIRHVINSAFTYHDFA